MQIAYQRPMKSNQTGDRQRIVQHKLLIINRGGVRINNLNIRLITRLRTTHPIAVRCLTKALDVT